MQIALRGGKMLGYRVTIGTGKSRGGKMKGLGGGKRARMGRE